jgi:hypothetical protein
MRKGSRRQAQDCLAKGMSWQYGGTGNAARHDVTRFGLPRGGLFAGKYDRGFSRRSFSRREYPREEPAFQHRRKPAA